MKNFWTYCYKIFLNFWNYKQDRTCGIYYCAVNSPQTLYFKQQTWTSGSGIQGLLLLGRFGWRLFVFVVVVQSLSCVQFFAIPCTTACQAPLSSSISLSLLKFTSIESVMPSNHLILCHPLLLLTSAFPSIMVFSNELALHIRQPKYWSFHFSISPSNEYSGLISFRIEVFDFLTVQGTLKSLLYHDNSKASILWHSAFFLVNSHIHT